jgi:hypothetical protein
VAHQPADVTAGLPQSLRPEVFLYPFGPAITTPYATDPMRPIGRYNRFKTNFKILKSINDLKSFGFSVSDSRVPLGSLPSWREAAAGV